MLDLIDLRAFASIADLKSISAAARALKTPKSSVSRSLMRLEAATGAILVERSTRHLRLTDAGLLFHPHVLRILNDLDEAESALSSLAASPRGDLRVNSPYAFTVGLLASMLPGFLGRYPQVRVIVELDNRRIDMLSQEVDLVVRVGPLPDSGLVGRRLATAEVWFCASPSYLKSRGTPAVITDLRGHDLVGRGDGVVLWSYRTPDGERGSIELTPRVVVPDPVPSQILVAGGAGIGRLPDYIAAGPIARGELVRVLADWQLDTMDIHALYPSHRSLSSKVRVFIDAMVAHVALVRAGISPR